jgi:HNH endonuclease
MPVRYLSPLPTMPKEFVEPTSFDHFIWWLFKSRCVVCRQPATEINEIIPRSRSKKSIQLWENRVTMCASCHREYHRQGVNDEAIEKLRKARHDFLMSMGREEYANYTPLDKVPDSSGKFEDSNLALGINMMLPDSMDFLFVDKG